MDKIDGISRGVFFINERRNESGIRKEELNRSIR
jgi:hypothetical protein